MFKSRWPYLVPAVLIAGAIGVVACSDRGPMEPTSSAPSFSTSSTPDTGFVRCTKQPYAKAGAYVGPAGGTITAGFGKIAIGKGALLVTTYITMEAVSDTINSVKLSPSGLVFVPGSQVNLTITSKNCPSATGKGKKIVYTSDFLRVISVLSSVFSSTTEATSANLSHFSRYAVHR